MVRLPLPPRNNPDRNNSEAARTPRRRGDLQAAEKSPVIQPRAVSTTPIMCGFAQATVSDGLEEDCRATWRPGVGDGLSISRQRRRRGGLFSGDLSGSGQDLAEGAGGRLVGAVAAFGDGSGDRSVAGSLSATRPDGPGGQFGRRVSREASPAAEAEASELAERLRAACPTCRRTRQRCFASIVWRI